MEGMGLKLTSVVVRHLLYKPSKHVWAYGWHFLDTYIASTNNPNRGYNPPPAAHPPPPPTPPPPEYPLIPLYVPLVILQWL